MTSSVNEMARERVYYPVFKLLMFVQITLVLHACVINAIRFNQARNPWLLLAACLVMIVWTGISWIIETRESEPSWGFIGADLAVGSALILLNPWAVGAELLGQNQLGVSGFFWIANVLTLLLWKGTRWGICCGAVFGILNLCTYPLFTQTALNQLVAVLVVTWMSGTIVFQLRKIDEERDANFTTAAALAERERLNRIVHDGVLQVLALVEREGNELGPKGRMLATLARVQEGKLRAMLQDKNVDVAGGDRIDHRQTDVATMLERHQSDTVTVSTMAGKVMVDAGRAAELNAAVTETLSNVSKHAGPDAKAWVLFELEDGEMTISVRDNGVGMTREQVEKAVAAGRLGVKESIVGRIESIGGTATVESKPGQGVEWEFKVPVE